MAKSSADYLAEQEEWLKRRLTKVLVKALSPFEGKKRTKKVVAAMAKVARVAIFAELHALTKPLGADIDLTVRDGNGKRLGTHKIKVRP